MNTSSLPVKQDWIKVLGSLLQHCKNKQTNKNNISKYTDMSAIKKNQVNILYLNNYFQETMEDQEMTNELLKFKVKDEQEASQSKASINFVYQTPHQLCVPDT